MRKLDLIVGVVGGLVLIGALAGAYMEGSTGASAAGTFPIEWQSKKTAFEAVRDREATFSVTDRNVTLVHFDAKVTAGAGYVGTGDKVTITVEGPDGNVTTKESALSTTQPTVTVSVEIPLNTVPKETQVTGADGASGLQALAMTRTVTRGMGDWKVTISVTRAVNAVGAPTFEISGYDTYYEAAIKAAQPSGVIK